MFRKPCAGRSKTLVCEREGPPEPLGPTIEFGNVVFAANPDYLDWLLRWVARTFSTLTS
jgi:hypothetical protein